MIEKFPTHTTWPGCKSETFRSDLSICLSLAASPPSLIYSFRYLEVFVDSPSLPKFIHVCSEVSV